MKIQRYIVFAALCVCTMLSGCAQWTITGQNSIWKVGDKPEDSGYELIGIYSNTPGKDRRIMDETDAISISLKTLYLKYIQSVYDFDILVYVEVYDLIDEKQVLRRIAFHRPNQPSDSYINLSGNLLYGPIHFRGYPITVKLNVLELDKKQNELFSKILEAASSIASAAQPQYGPAIETVASIMKFIITLNQDDLELSQEITFFPILGDEKLHYGEKASLVAPLETGDFVIVKREDKDRIVINRWWWFDKQSDEEAKKRFDPNKVYYDVNTGRLKYSGEQQEGEDFFVDKTYAVLTISKSPKAVERAMLEEISNNVQNTLNNLLTDTQKAESEQLAAIERMGKYGVATVKVFNIKNSLTGKTPEDKKAKLTELEKTENNEIVKDWITQYLKKIED